MSERIVIKIIPPPPDEGLLRVSDAGRHELKERAVTKPEAAEKVSNGLCSSLLEKLEISNLVSGYIIRGYSVEVANCCRVVAE